MRKHLMAWQWSDYANKHGARMNLLIHIVAVPMFWLGGTCILGFPFHRSVVLLVGGLLAGIVSLAVQGRGHRLEDESPTPFLGPLDAVSRLMLEQLVTFPRYVLTGGWWRALRSAR